MITDHRQIGGNTSFYFFNLKLQIDIFNINYTEVNLDIFHRYQEAWTNRTIMPGRVQQEKNIYLGTLEIP